MKFSFAIAAYSISKSDAMKQGDIIAYRPVGWEWGSEEKKRFLITEIDVKDEAEAISLCFPIIKEETIEGEKVNTIVKKRKYNVDMSKLDLDNAKLENIALEYQPIKEVSKTLIKEKNG